MSKGASYQSKNLDHLGLVAGMFDELGIGEVIDKLVKQDLEQRDLSVGTLVKAMVLNGLGFVNQRLYLVSHFFKNKPIDRLLGTDVSAEKLNDDALGRALDALYRYGVTELYSRIGAQAARRLGLKPKIDHLDSSSFHLDGVYNSDEAPEEELGIIHITKGYSRDHRPDLNQVVLDLVVESQASIPLLMKPEDGNETDKEAFKRIIKEHVRQLQADNGISILVADSAIYTQDSLIALQQRGVKWITRVPATLAEVKRLLKNVNPESLAPLAEGYRYQSLSREYADVKQRWLLVYSKEAAKRACKTVERQLLKVSEQELKAWQTLCRQRFACAEDAHKALAAFQAKLTVCQLHEPEVLAQARYRQAGRPANDTAPDYFEYSLAGALSIPLQLKQQRIDQQACFVLASNVLDPEELTDQEILKGYKGQVHVERGFRFLKDLVLTRFSGHLRAWGNIPRKRRCHDAHDSCSLSARIQS
jgi:transposase